MAHVCIHEVATGVRERFLCENNNNNDNNNNNNNSNEIIKSKNNTGKEETVQNPCKMRMNIDFFIHWSMTVPC